MLDIIFEDEHIAVCAKPAGVASQSEHSLAPDMVSLLMNHFAANTPPTNYVGVVHRLDKPVAGLLVYGKHKKAAANLTTALQTNEFSKNYYAMVCSPEALSPSETYTELRNHLYHNKKDNSSSIVEPSNKEAKEAILMYRTLYSMPIDILQDNGIATRAYKAAGISYLSLVDVKLITGRHHQIRVQMAGAGLPLWGDARYSGLRFSNTTVALCSYSLAFPHPVTKKALSFSIEPSNSIFPVVFEYVKSHL